MKDWLTEKEGKMLKILSWAIKICICIILACGISIAYTFMTKPIPGLEPESMHFVHGDLFIIIDDDEKEWFYGE